MTRSTQVEFLSDSDDSNCHALERDPACDERELQDEGEGKMTVNELFTKSAAETPVVSSPATQTLLELIQTPLRHPEIFQQLGIDCPKGAVLLLSAVLSIRLIFAILFFSTVCVLFCA